jgi:hypothetical protein
MKLASSVVDWLRLPTMDFPIPMTNISSTSFLPFGDGELQYYIDCCIRLDLPDSDIAGWMCQLGFGSDKAVRAILMALLPNLETLTFV